MLSLLALVAASAYGAVMHERAAQWRQASEEGARELAEVSEERDQTVVALEETEQKFVDTQDEVARLEDRVADVTTEREQARDELARLSDDLDVAASVATVLAGIGADLSVCVDDLFHWIGDRPATFDSPPAWDSYFGRGYAIAELCGRARTDFDDFLRATAS